jgi:hypothetical protein
MGFMRALSSANAAVVAVQALVGQRHAEVHDTALAHHGRERHARVRTARRRLAKAADAAVPAYASGQLILNRAARPWKDRVHLTL